MLEGGLLASGEPSFAEIIGICAELQNRSTRKTGNADRIPISAFRKRLADRGFKVIYKVYFFYCAASST